MALTGISCYYPEPPKRINNIRYICNQGEESGNKGIIFTTDRLYSGYKRKFMLEGENEIEFAKDLAEALANTWLFDDNYDGINDESPYRWNDFYPVERKDDYCMYILGDSSNGYEFINDIKRTGKGIDFMIIDAHGEQFRIGEKHTEYINSQDLFQQKIENPHIGGYFNEDASILITGCYTGMRPTSTSVSFAGALANLIDTPVIASRGKVKKPMNEEIYHLYYAGNFEIIFPTD